MTVGPDYVKIKSETADKWHTQLKGGLSEEVLNPETLACWWTTLNDPVLSHIIKRAVSGNLNLKGAVARIDEARALRGINRAGFFPLLNADASATKYQDSKNSENRNRDRLYAAGFDADWELDVFGGVRRSVEAADANIEVAQEGLHDVLVNLQAEVAINYVEVRTYQKRLAIIKANIKTQEEILKLNRSLYKAGIINELTVQESLYSLEHLHAAIPVLQTGLEAAKNRLAVLLGEKPGSIHGELYAEKSIPVPPAMVAVGIPAETLRRRPDIRRAERNLAAMTARIGIATANLYPKFRLFGTIGLESVSTGDLLTSASRAWSFGPRISWNIFDASAIRQKIKAESAIQKQALIQYESTILNALEEVENVLIAYTQEQSRHRSLEAATVAARKAYELSLNLYKAGLINFNNVLTSQYSMQLFEDKLALSNGAIASNFIRLYKALGGGWEYSEQTNKSKS